MQCQNVQPLLDAYRDGELSPLRATAVARHLDACVACQAELTDRRLLLALLDSPAGHQALSVPARELPTDFALQVLQLLPPLSAGGESGRLPAVTPPTAGVNLLWPWLQRRWSGAQVASLVYAMGTSVAVAAAAVLLLSWQQGPEQLTVLRENATDYWVQVRVGIDVLGAWLSRLVPGTLV